MDVLILVVTMTGTAEMLAEDVVAEHGTQHAIKMRLAEHCTPEELQQASNLIVISSTYGVGEIPDPGKPLFQRLENALPHLSHLRFGVVSLGDSVYPETFARGGLHWDELLERAGARRLSAPLLLDASGDMDQSALTVEWAGQWLLALAEHEQQQGPGK